MKQFTRGFAAFLTVVAVYYFVFWVGGALITAIGLPYWVARLAGLAAALVTGSFVWHASASLSPGLARSVAVVSLVLGSIGFVGGFFGPIVFMPEANQGPLLGIFITGPLGFLLADHAACPARRGQPSRQGGGEARLRGHDADAQDRHRHDRTGGESGGSWGRLKNGAKERVDGWRSNLTVVAAMIQSAIPTRKLVAFPADAAARMPALTWHWWWGDPQAAARMHRW